MRYFAYLAVIVSLLLTACQKETNEREQKLLPPTLTSYRSQNQATIHIAALSRDLVWRPFDYVAPERFRIFRSVGDINHFVQIDDVPNDETYVYTDLTLQAGTPYFYYIQSEKGGLETVVSDTIMLIPSEVEQPDRLTSTQAFPIQSASIAPTGDKIAFTDPTYTWDNGMYGATSLFIYDLNVQTSSLVQRSAVFPDWSADGNKLAFCTDLNEVAIEPGYIPQHLSLLDVPSGNITQLTSGAEFVLNPEISRDGEWIVFTSDESHKGQFDLWIIRTDGTEKTQLTDGLDHTMVASGSELGRPTWSSNGNEIYYGISSDSDEQDGIFKLNISGNAITPILQSPWKDLGPVLSPDDSKMAFFSDRSGRMEIWLLDLQSGDLRQLTGTESNFVETTWGKLEWIGNETLLYVAYPNDGSGLQTVFKLNI